MKAPLIIAGVCVLLTGFMMGLMMQKPCPRADAATIKALTAHIAQQDTVIAQVRRESARYLATADSLSAITPPTVNEVLRTIPSGRTTAELDSIGTIIFAPW